MTFYELYSIQGEFDNTALRKLLHDLNVEEHLINDIIIRCSVSSLTKELINHLKDLDENSNNIINILFEFFLLADTSRPISCNKEKLSELTGLSQRQIDEKRRSREIPYIQISGGNGVGKKTIVYDPLDVMMKLEEYKVQAVS